MRKRRDEQPRNQRHRVSRGKRGWEEQKEVIKAQTHLYKQRKEKLRRQKEVDLQKRGGLMSKENRIRRKA